MSPCEPADEACVPHAVRRAAVTAASDARLAALAATARDGLRKLGEPFRPWTVTPEGVDADVLIVGAGQSGLAVGFALRRAGVGRVRIVSRDGEGAEGPWRSFARMPTLRSPKTAPGPELGLPDLAYESWHLARHGPEDYASLDLIRTEDWAEYLDWFRRTVGLDVEQRRTLVDLDGDDAGTAVVARFADGGRIVARQVVLATGMDALGGPTLPPELAGIPQDFCASCYDHIDFTEFPGKRIAVVGAASTGFDNAAAALEAGAAAVDLYCRQPELRAVNHMKGVAQYGLVAHWADFDDATRWRLARLGVSRPAPPTGPTVARACRWPNFRILLGARIEAAHAAGAGVEIVANGVERRYDCILVAAGYGLDDAWRPELRRLTAAMARWRDRYRPPAEATDAALGAYPYLTPGFAFLPREADGPAWLGRVRLFAGPAVVSMGRIVGESSNLRYGVPRLATALTTALATEDRAALFAEAAAYAVRETAPADYAAAAHVGGATDD